jgi:hypothetical protein
MPREPEVVLVEHVARAERDVAHLGEGDAGAGVEVDAQLVGMVEVGAPHGPGVPVDDAEVDAPDEVGAVVGDELARVAPAGEGDGGGLQPVGGAVGHALLEEGLAADAVDPALERGGPLAQVAHDGGLALDVVVDEIDLGETSVGEERLVGIADAHLTPAHLDNDRLAFRGGHCWKDARS